ncbi:ribosomal maturation YjgA family protein [Xanthomarina spongicola]|uniref:Uncharacterized protein DUF2809 n=1 Tax=Xanthomarina spongicola TaxID=570520 RepID=A0A316E5L9_9FLAO|nr:DUF2809 domain-containing protein [Xanthomarina spongicola]PWK18230.1 uncharacterized protein DUF2809 [Xanthomarina spongicola]
MESKFNKTYFLVFITLLFTEILIVKYFKTGFIRHTLGDFLVVILLYSFIKSFLIIKPIQVAICVLLIAFLVEFLQLLNLLEALNLQNNTMAKLVLGNTFQITDLLAYTLGIISILTIEYKLKRF